MSILDSFYILFKSNAKDVKKDMGEAQKATDDFQKKINEADKAVGSIATNLLEIGVTAVAAFAGFNGIKDGIAHAYDLNLHLDKTRRLTGENAEEILAWDQAFQHFGSAKGEFTDWFVTYSQYLQSIGRDSKQVLPDLRNLSNTLKALPENQARRLFQQISKATGLPQSFYLSLIQGGDALDAIIAKQEKLIKENEESEKAARSFSQAWQDVGTAIDSIFSKLTTKLMGYFAYIGRILSNLLTGNLKDAFNEWRFPAGIPSSQGAPTPAPARTGALGDRSFNPGNLQPGGVESVFGSPQEGIAAELKNLERYGARGWNTLASIASHWAPAKAGNNVAAYIKTLMKQTGYGANDSLNLNDPTVRANVAKAINVAEGDTKYNDLLNTAKGALNIADNSSLNRTAAGGDGNAPSLSIGNITIQTLATDAKGIATAISDKLKQEYRLVMSNFDDGVNR